jgi:hypothetical protein
MHDITYSCSVALFLIVVFAILVRKNLVALLRDTSILPVAQRSFSLASTITFYWTVLIILSICYIGIVNDCLPVIDNSVLILMGIVAGTTTAGKVIDASQSQDPTIARSQDTTQSVGFLTDILSDSNGISVSRFQTVMFNIIYGCVFVGVVISQRKLYDFPTQTLTLLGISSGAYALLKIPENTPPTVTPPPVMQPPRVVQSLPVNQPAPVSSPPPVNQPAPLVTPPPNVQQG